MNVSSITRNPLTLAAALGAGVVVLIWLKAKSDGKSVTAVVVEDVARGAAEVATAAVKATGSTVYNTAKRAASDVALVWETAADREFISKVAGLTGVHPRLPAEENIIINMRPTGSMAADGLPIVDLWPAFWAWRAAAAVREFRKSAGVPSI
ncbi:hypothetical protein ACTSKR_09485 [Chitinibacteraceae bacterium HSL-7]